MPAHKYMEEISLTSMLAVKEVGRCHTSGESQECVTHMPLPSTNKMSLEVQTGISVAHKGIYVLQNYF